MQQPPSTPADSTDRLVIDAIFSDYPFPGFLDPIRRRAAEFEREHPRYRVRVRGFGYQEIPAQVARLAELGQPPTIASYYSGASRQARDTLTRDGRPLFTSVEQAVAGRAEILGEPVMLADFTAAARGFYTYQGDFTSLPLTASTMVFYANTTLLRAAGVAEVPRTWREVELACARLAGWRPRPSVAWPNDGKLFQQWLSQQRAELVNEANGRGGRASAVHLTTEPMLALVSWWRRLNERGYFHYSGTFEDWEGTIAAFAEQRIAMRVGSSFEVASMREAAGRAGFELAVAPLPHRDGAAPAGNWIGGDSIWLADGLHPDLRDGALAFLQYLSAPHHAADWHRATGSTPVTRGGIAALTADGWFAEHPQHLVAVEQIDTADGSPGSHSPLIPGSYEVQLAIMEAMDDVLRHGADPAGRFARAQVAAQRGLAAYNSACTSAGPRDPGWVRVGS